jgi:hypothetical protein
VRHTANKRTAGGFMPAERRSSTEQVTTASESRSSRTMRLCAAAVLTVVAIAIHLHGHSSAQIIRNAVCTANAGQLNCNSSGLGGITNAADAIVSPIFVALIAVAPIACLIGAGAIMFGNRRGVIMVASALGALVLAGAVKGIVA